MSAPYKEKKVRKDKLPAFASWSRTSRLVLLAAVILAVLISGFYLYYQWNKYDRAAREEGIILAQSLEALLHPEHIMALSGSAGDLDQPDYFMIKLSLIRLARVTNPIRFAYLMREQGDQIIFLADSVPADSPDYSPPGQVYEEADEWTRMPFITGQTVATPPTTDRWGTWISMITPIRDPQSGRVIAALGIDYDAADWYRALWAQMIPDLMVVSVFWLLCAALFQIWSHRARLDRLNKRLALDEALYRSAFEQAPIGVAIVEDKRFISQADFSRFTINPMFRCILGRSTEELVKVSWTEITHPDDLQEDLRQFELFRSGEIKGYTMEKRFVKPDGTAVWVSMSISPLIGIRDDNSLHLCLIEDITRRREAALALKESERREAVLLSHLPGLAYRCRYDRDGTMLIVSEGCFPLTGYPPEAFIHSRDLPFNDIISLEGRQLLLSEWERSVPAGLPYRCEYEITAASGERKWVLEMGQGIYDERGAVQFLEGIILDITDRKRMENELRYTAEHNGLTGLYNRDFLELTLGRDLRRGGEEKRALISINLSTIQRLTVIYGFHYTQNLVKRAAETLSGFCSDSRMLYQTYENRFALYIRGYAGKEDLTELCDGIAGAMEALFAAERIGGGIGVLEIGEQDTGKDADLLLRRLLIASERSLSLSDRDFQTCFYDAALEALIDRENIIRQSLADIAADASNDDFYVQYQPIIDLKTDAVCGFEALARLRIQRLGQVSPNEFIPIAEKTRLTIPIGEKVMISTLRFLKRLDEQGIDDIVISVNISAIELLQPDFACRLLGLIASMGVNPKCVGIEITESVFAADYEEVNRIIQRLREAGIHLSIDDFGTGYSSLAREEELKVNCLKIDKHFIDRLLEPDLDRAITGDIISMAHRLGHCAVAEGVEVEAQKQYLIAHGCDRMQGFLFSRALDEDAALALLKRDR